jgi:hypothetical protein
MYRRAQASIEHIGYLLAHLAVGIEAVQNSLEDVVTGEGAVPTKEAVESIVRLVNVLAEDVSSGISAFGAAVPVLAAYASEICTGSTHLTASPGVGAPCPAEELQSATQNTRTSS